MREVSLEREGHLDMMLGQGDGDKHTGWGAMGTLHMPWGAILRLQTQGGPLGQEQTIR